MKSGREKGGNVKEKERKGKENGRKGTEKGQISSPYPIPQRRNPTLKNGRQYRLHPV
jgi:hypothetical protein